MNRIRPIPLLATSLVLLFTTAANSYAQTDQEQLGDFLYNDLQLSEPAGQGCVSCHDPAFGFADPEQHLPVSEGVIPGRFGNRNSPSAAYAMFFPEFTLTGGIQGGQFWDGRAATLAEQAKGPFLNLVEMNNTTRGQVIGKIAQRPYAALFEQVCGPNAFAPVNVDRSYDCTATSIAAFEGTVVFKRFTSKFDAVAANQASFTPQEKEGWDLFTGKAKCDHCHTAKVGANQPVLFTDFKFHNIGVPENRELFALLGAPFTDPGLGGFLNDPKDNGKFKNPHLRDIEMNPPLYLSRYSD